MVHALKALRPYLLYKPFELYTDNASLQWLQQKRHVSHHQARNARWINLLAEYRYRILHIPGRSHPADFLTRRHFPDGSGPAPHTGYDEPDSVLELLTVSGAAPASTFMAAGPAAESTRFLHADLAAAVCAALLSDLVCGPLAAAEQAQDPSAACPLWSPSSAATGCSTEELRLLAA